jgi:vacuolar-type H+-ATPase subunit C/Vma6
MQSLVGIGFIASIVSELAAATYTSLKESNLAFLAPRILNSKIVSLASNLDLLLQTGKTEMIREAASEYDLKLSPQTRKFKDLQQIENFLIREYEQSFNKFLFFLPENLRDFFEEWKILRDFENLKTLLACITNQVPTEHCLHLLGPQGKITRETLKQLSESKTVKDVLRNGAAYFPSGTISQINLQDETVLDHVQSALDRVAANYISESCLKVKIQDPEEIQKLVNKKYEIKDIITVARLKQYDVPPQRIIPLLIGKNSKLTEGKIEKLALAKNYKIFYSLISDTYYGKALPSEPLSPRDLEEFLQRSFFTELTKPKESVGEKMVIHFMVGLEYCFPTMWKAIIFSFIGEDEE